MAGWRRGVAAGLRRETAADQFRLLFALNPPRGYFPFLTPYQSLDGFEAGLDAVRSTPTGLLRRDLTCWPGRTHCRRRPPRWPGASRRCSAT